MHGHECLIDERKQGKKPRSICINDFVCLTDWDAFKDTPTVCVAGDKLSEIDLSFVHGVAVDICGSTEERAKEIFEMAKDAGASMVGACHTTDKFNANSWVGVWHGMD